MTMCWRSQNVIKQKPSYLRRSPNVFEAAGQLVTCQGPKHVDVLGAEVLAQVGMYYYLSNQSNHADPLRGYTVFCVGRIMSGVAYTSGPYHHSFWVAL